MFYDEERASLACEENPKLIFYFINGGYKEIVEKVLDQKIVDINLKDKTNTDIISNLLIKNWYDLVIKYMKNKEWNVNSQNKMGNTFAHILVTKNYLDVLPIIDQLKKNKKFIPNIKNKNGETILDKSINNKYIALSMKILEDKRFDNIDIISFKSLYDNYVKSSEYGRYSKISNLEIIVDSLSEKKLRPSVKKLINLIDNNIDVIKEQALNDEINFLDSLVNSYIENLFA